MARQKTEIIREFNKSMNPTVKYQALRLELECDKVVMLNNIWNELHNIASIIREDVCK